MGSRVKDAANGTVVRYTSDVAEKLTSVDPHELGRALLDNSNALVWDACVLVEHERHPRAAALALMALEEMSKI